MLAGRALALSEKLTLATWTCLRKWGRVSRHFLRDLLAQSSDERTMPMNSSSSWGSGYLLRVESPVYFRSGRMCSSVEIRRGRQSGVFLFFIASSTTLQV
jgi:hypothetical protein